MRALIDTTRPLTALFSFVLVVTSFCFWQPTEWGVALLTAATYALVTGHIMSYNDYVDRFHDRKKGKNFAFQNSAQFGSFCAGLAGVIFQALLLLAMVNPWLALFCTSIWLLGIGYSHAPQLYLANNLIVALCSGSPALVAVVYHGEIRFEPWLLFLIFTALILVREVYKDIEDEHYDRGYKQTVLIRRGIFRTVFGMFGLMYLPQVLILCYPNWWVKLVAFGFGPVAFAHALLFANLFEPRPEARRQRTLHSVALCKETLDWVLPGIVLMALTTAVEDATQLLAPAVFVTGLFLMIRSFWLRARRYLWYFRVLYRAYRGSIGR